MSCFIAALLGSVGEKDDKDGDVWLADDGLDGKYYVQRIALDEAGRSRKDIAQAWINTLVKAIRKYDTKHMITVGTIPWAFAMPGAKPEIETCDNLDFISVHFYPKGTQIDKALDALKQYEIGKPLVIEEFFSIECTLEELENFIDESRHFTDGYISFHWGQTVEDLQKINFTYSVVFAEYYRYFKYKSAQLAIR